MSSAPTPRGPHPEFWIPLAYVILAALWILVSDRVVAAASHTADDMARMSMFKGWAFVASTGAFLHLLLRNYVRKVTRSEQKIIASERRHRELVEGSPDAILLQRDDRVVYANRAAKELFGAASDLDLVGHDVVDLVSEVERSSLRDRTARARAGLAFPKVVRRVLIKCDGTPFHADVALGAFDWLDRPALQVVVRDVSETWRLQEAEARVNAALRLTGAINEVLVRATSESEEALLASVCRVAVEEGNLGLAWVGAAPSADDPAGLRPIAHYGLDAAVAEPLLCAETEGERCPAAVAIQTRSACVVTDLASDQRFPGWREAALRAGFASSATLPIFTEAPADDDPGRASEPGGSAQNGHPVLVLGFFSRTSNAFDDAVVRLLGRLATNIAFRIESLRAKAEVAKAQALLAAAVDDLRALTGRLETIREDEKTRIARDLHDEFGQLLTALDLDLAWIERRVNELPTGATADQMVDRVVGATSLVRQLLASARRISADLRPSVLDQLGLGAALREELRRFGERSGLGCDLSLSGSLQDERGELATALFRIIQEALTNVLRHAEAKHVWVTLSGQGGRLEVRVEDDGKGFDPRPGAARGQRRGLGLLGIEERSRRFGGEVVCGRSARGGAMLTLSLPACGLANVASEAACSES